MQVFLSASHNRLAHSLGVAYQAHKFAKTLAVNYDESLVSALNLEKHEIVPSPEELLTLQVSALFHDAGHGPKSHLWERVMRELSSTDGGHDKSWCALCSVMHPVVVTVPVIRTTSLAWHADLLPPQRLNRQMLVNTARSFMQCTQIHGQCAETFSFMCCIQSRGRCVGSMSR